MIHIQKFIERLQGFEARGARDFTMPIKDAKDLHADLTRLLHETRLSSEAIEGNIRAQIADYIPEIEGLEYDLSVDFLEDPERHQEVMVINFSLNGYQVDAFVK